MQVSENKLISSYGNLLLAIKNTVHHIWYLNCRVILEALPGYPSCPVSSYDSNMIL